MDPILDALATRWEKNLPAKIKAAKDHSRSVENLRGRLKGFAPGHGLYMGFWDKNGILG